MPVVGTMNPVLVFESKRLSLSKDVPRAVGSGAFHFSVAQWLGELLLLITCALESTPAEGRMSSCESPIAPVLMSDPLMLLSAMALLSTPPVRIVIPPTENRPSWWLPTA